MTRWKFSMLVLGVAVVAGSIGSWTGPTFRQSFAQDARRPLAQSPGESPEADRGWVGVMVEQGTDGGLLVKDVFPGGPGAFARLRKGDALVRIGDVSIRNEEELASAVEQLQPGDEAVVVVLRNDQEQTLRLRVGSLRKFHEHYGREMWRRDPRDPGFADSHGVSQADLSIELARRLFEQNERLETSLHDLRQELAALRRDLEDRKPATR